MLNPLFRTLVKVAVASLVVGTIMAHFGITAEQLMREVGLLNRAHSGIREARLRVGLAKCAAGFNRDHTHLVCGFFVSPAGQKQ